MLNRKNYFYMNRFHSFLYAPLCLLYDVAYRNNEFFRSLGLNLFCSYSTTAMCGFVFLCVSLSVQARSQKLAMGGLFWGSEGGAPAAGGQWGFGGEGPSRRRLGVWGKSPQPPEARGSGGGAHSARKFCIFFAKITSF